MSDELPVGRYRLIGATSYVNATENTTVVVKKNRHASGTWAYVFEGQRQVFNCNPTFAKSHFTVKKITKKARKK